MSKTDGIVFEADGIFFSSVGGMDGDFDPIGTPRFPSNSLVNVRTLASAAKTRKIMMTPGITGACVATLDVNMRNYIFEGVASEGVTDVSSNIKVDANGKSISNSIFKNLCLCGTAYGTSVDMVRAENCTIGLSTNFYSIKADKCFIDTTNVHHIALGYFNECWTKEIGATFDFSLAAFLHLYFTRWSGNMVVKGMCGGVSPIGTTVNIEGKGKITIGATCTGGNIYVPQDFEVVDLSGGLVTINRTNAIKSVDAVYVDSSVGVAGTADTNGLPQNPSSGVASEVKTMLENRKLRAIKVLFGVLSVDVLLQSVYIEGKAPTVYNAQLLLDGIHSISQSSLKNIYVIGTLVADDFLTLDGCTLGCDGSLAPINLYANDLKIIGSTIFTAKTWRVTGCSVIDSNPYSPPLINMSGVAAQISITGWSGNVRIGAMIAGQEARFEGKGTVTLDATCLGGDLYVDGGILVSDLSGNAVTIHRVDSDVKFVYEGRVTAVPGVNEFTLGGLAGTIPVGMLMDAVKPWSAYVKRDAGGTGLAPQGQILPLTAASNAAVFKTAGFTAAVGTGDAIQIIHPSLADIMSQTCGNRKIKDDTEAILLAIGGALDARFLQSASGPVEEDAVMGFDISIFDIDLGAVLQANIDIASITAVLERSRAGGVFSAVGIIQPTFLKADGRVYTSHRFLSAEWVFGDIYRLRVANVSCTIDGATLYCPAMVWSNKVDEVVDLDAMIKTHWRESGGIDVNISSILANETNVLELAASANTTYMLNHLRLKSADPGVNTVIVRLYEEVNGVLTNVGTYNIGTTGYINDFADHFSLMDMFSLAHCAGNNIKVTVQASGGGPYAVTAQYQYATATV